MYSWRRKLGTRASRETVAAPAAPAFVELRPIAPECIEVVLRCGVVLRVSKSSLVGRRNDYEYELIERVHGALPPDVAVTLLADRGFGDQKLYAFLQSLGWDFVIRFKAATLVEDAAGTQKPAGAWIPNSGRATMLKGARVTSDRAPVPAVVVVRQARMKDSWCLATSLAEKKGLGGRGPVRQEIHDRGDLPRREGPTLRHGAQRDAHP